MIESDVMVLEAGEVASMNGVSVIGSQSRKLEIRPRFDFVLESVFCAFGVFAVDLID